MSRPRRLRVWGPAKINLGLEVVGRRPDGYHEVATLLQSVSLFDLFEWTETGAPFEYVGPESVDPATDLVARALATATDRHRWTGRLRLMKRIPLAAGLGGGSVDAALALRLALPDASETELHARASELGADVPFGLHGGTALATGTGTTLAWLSSSRYWIVLVTPALEVPNKTRTFYSGLRELDFSDGGVVRALAARKGATVAPVALPNAFARQLLGYPDIRYAYDCLRRGGGEIVSASGAGPTIFALTTTYAAAAAIASRLPRGVGHVAVVRTIGGGAGDAAAQAIARAMRGVPAER